MPSWLALPPYNVPLFTAAGAMSPAWQWYLYQVFTGALAIQELQILEAFDASSGTQALALAKDATVGVATADLVPPTAAALDAIRKQLAAIGETPSTVLRLDALEKLTWALAGGPPAPVVLTGLDALRSATPALPNTVWFATDTDLLWVAVAGFWVKVTAIPAPPGAWTGFTPTVAPGGAMTFTGTAAGRYQKIGKTVNVRVELNGTIGGTPSNVLGVTLPVTQEDDNQTVAVQIIRPSGAQTSGNVNFNGATGAEIYQYDGSTYSAGSTIVFLQGGYEAA